MKISSTVNAKTRRLICGILTCCSIGLLAGGISGYASVSPSTTSSPQPPNGLHPLVPVKSTTQPHGIIPLHVRYLGQDVSEANSQDIKGRPPPSGTTTSPPPTTPPTSWVPPPNYTMTTPTTTLTTALNGGTFVSADGNASVTIPLGVTVYTTSGQITITPANTSPVPPSNAKSLGLYYYDFEPNDAVFSSPVIITISYNSANLPAGTDQSKIYIASWDTSTSQWFTIPSKVNQENHTVTASVSYFTYFSAMITVTSGVSSSKWVILVIIGGAIIVVGLICLMFFRQRRGAQSKTNTKKYKS